MNFGDMVSGNSDKHNPVNKDLVQQTSSKDGKEGMIGMITQGEIIATVGENPEILSHNISNKISIQNSSLLL